MTIRCADFPDDTFQYTIPEAIGSTARAVLGARLETLIAPVWTVVSDQECSYEWRKAGVLAFTAHAWAKSSQLDVRIRLKNLSAEAWPESLSFSCFGLRRASTFADFEGTRTFLLLHGRWIPITRLEHKDSRRPTIQLWYVRDKPQNLAFVENFRATPAFYPEGVLAVRSCDGRHLIAVTADKPLFLFSNLEFACVHCCPGFGPLRPGEEGEAKHTVFICKDASLAQLKQELGSV